MFSSEGGVFPSNDFWVVGSELINSSSNSKIRFPLETLSPTLR